ncbi:response regulator transcription factor [Mucilaginibacter daejeonensis]|uniref:response regulator n=1 Tax=Mucilaginibacter daejeonensis TaxID=398049 RepID=UPI001D179FFF|nr:response regulator transcription factor [Mucilaginibacter daejeonensis]UEG52440.1 response regulator transcription factor [Mucilaginibacter daejeonensis]
MIKILLAEDHAIVRNALKELLEKVPTIRVVGEALNGSDVISMITTLEADILLADLNMPGLNGVDLARQLNQQKHPIKVMMLTMHDHRSYVIDAFRAGVQAYLIKNVSGDELVFAIKQVHSGRKYLANELSLQLLDERLKAPVQVLEGGIKAELSAREKLVLELMAEGLTNQQIADRLFTSKRTVEGHRQAMIKKTGVSNTASLIKYAMINQLI